MNCRLYFCTVLHLELRTCQASIHIRTKRTSGIPGKGHVPRSDFSKYAPKVTLDTRNLRESVFSAVVQS